MQTVTALSTACSDLKEGNNPDAYMALSCIVVYCPTCYVCLAGRPGGASWVLGARARCEHARAPARGAAARPAPGLLRCELPPLLRLGSKLS